MSKGSWQRPYDKKKFDDNWDRIFKKVNEGKKEDGCVTYETYGDYEEFDSEEEMVNRITGQDYEDYEAWRDRAEEENDSGC